MRLTPLWGLALLSAFSAGCSNDKDGSQVTPGGGGNGAADAGGKGATGAGGSSSSTGGGLGLAGSVALGEAGNASGGDGATAMPDLPTDVNVIIAADNAYGFGYGTKTELAN